MQIAARVQAHDAIAIGRIPLGRQVRRMQLHTRPNRLQLHASRAVGLRLERTAIDRELDEDIEEAVDLERPVAVVGAPRSARRETGALGSRGSRSRRRRHRR